jgi:hypothetical protein
MQAITRPKFHVPRFMEPVRQSISFCPTSYNELKRTKFTIEELANAFFSNSVVIRVAIKELTRLIEEAQSRNDEQYLASIAKETLRASSHGPKAPPAVTKGGPR